MAGAGMCRVQQLVSQAKATFSLKKSDSMYLKELEKLRTIMSGLKPEDFNINPSLTKKTWDYPSLSITDAPAAFLDVYECPEFSVAIFLLKPKKQMPLHNHPGMFGLMKILFGSMIVTSYNTPENTDKIPYLAHFCSSVMATSQSDLCSLNESQGNIHEIEAQDEPVAFLDILAPPYDPAKGRNCVYYSRQSPPTDRSEVHKSAPERSVWLKPGPNPWWFTCIPQEYSGPKVN